ASKNPEFASLAKHVKVKVVSEGALIELVEGGDNFLFNVASSDLKPGAIKILEELAPILSKLDNRIEIHGHTDARPFGVGSKKTNWELSFERGDRARRVLESGGIAKGKIQSVLAHADSALYNPDEPLSPENRRLAILVVRASAQNARAGLTTASSKSVDDSAEDPSDKDPDEAQAKSAEKKPDKAADAKAEPEPEAEPEKPRRHRAKH
ncbi:MAG: motB, partial [Myxococcaceae bacterium]|nr:motB [Myxococcaceae bacterium]